MQFASEQAGRVKIVRVDGDLNPSLLTRFQIAGYPTSVFLVGGIERNRMTGSYGDAADDDNALTGILQSL